MSKTYRRSRQRRNKLSKKRGGGPKRPGSQRHGSQMPGSQKHMPGSEPIIIKFVGRPNFLGEKALGPPLYSPGYEPEKIVPRIEKDKIIFGIPTRQGDVKEYHIKLKIYEQMKRKSFVEFKKLQDYFISELKNEIENPGHDGNWICVKPSGGNRNGHFEMIPEKVEDCEVMDDKYVTTNPQNMSDANAAGILWFPQNYKICIFGLTEYRINQAIHNAGIHVID